MEELGLFGGLRDAVSGFLNFSFAKRLREKGIKLMRSVDWHENQGQDRGWNYGMHKFYPQVMAQDAQILCSSRMPIFLE